MKCTNHLQKPPRLTSLVTTLTILYTPSNTGWILREPTFAPTKYQLNPQCIHRRKYPTSLHQKKYPTFLITLLLSIHTFDYIKKYSHLLSWTTQTSPPCNPDIKIILPTCPKVTFRCHP